MAAPGINYGQGFGGAPPPKPIVNTPPPQPPATKPNTISPEYLTGQFPNGIPQATFTPSNVDTSPARIMQSILAMMAPQFANQNMDLSQAFANAGIMGGPAPGAQAELGLNQQATAEGAIAPILQQAIGQQLQQSEFNATGAADTSRFNTGNLLGAGQFDATQFNNFLSQMLGNQNQDWLAKLGAVSGISGAGAGNQTGAFQPVFNQPSPDNGLFQLAGGIGSLFGSGGAGSLPTTGSLMGL